MQKDDILLESLTDTVYNEVHMIPVANKNHLPGLTHLRKEIVRIANNKKLCPNVNHVVPESWVKLEQLCNHEKTFHKTISVDELYEKASTINFVTKDDMLKALKYIVSIGPILYFYNIASIRNVVFLDPNWLSSIFKLIFRHDSDVFFVYKQEYENFYEFENEFNQDKSYLLESGELSYNFLRFVKFSFLPKINRNFILLSIFNISSFSNVLCSFVLVVLEAVEI